MAMESMVPNPPDSDLIACLREASFSSYLDANVECSPQKLAGDAYDKDGEIEVFTAEKYFNGSIDEERPRLVHSMELQPETKQSGSSRTSGMTPSTGSQQSWNNRALLLQRQQPRKVSEVRSKSLLASIICCRSGCDTNDSGDIGFRDNRDGFVQRGQWRPDFVLEKKLTMLPWSDVVPRKEDQNAPYSCSDDTLDLFEIESLTGKASRLLTWHDAASEGTHVLSEASVEWSVVTESAAATEFLFDERSELTGTSSLERRPVNGSNRNKTRKDRARNGIQLRC